MTLHTLLTPAERGLWLLADVRRMGTASGVSRHDLLHAVGRRVRTVSKVYFKSCLGGGFQQVGVGLSNEEVSNGRTFIFYYLFIEV